MREREYLQPCIVQSVVAVNPYLIIHLIFFSVSFIAGITWIVYWFCLLLCSQWKLWVGIESHDKASQLFGSLLLSRFLCYLFCLIFTHVGGFCCQVEQLHKIYKLCGSPSDEYWKRSKLPNATLFKPREPYKRRIRETFKDFPPSSLPLIDTLLAIDPADRQTATAALRSEVSSKVPFCFFLLLVHLEPIVFSSCSNISYLKWHKRTYRVFQFLVDIREVAGMTLTFRVEIGDMRQSSGDSCHDRRWVLHQGCNLRVLDCIT